jgi:hypothetical protein
MGLLAAAERLLKGCAQHFRNQINRVKKISGVVDPSKTDIFENYARKLLSCESIDEFNHHATEFIKAFPRAESWIRWWMLPAHAIMLFPSFRIMKPELWESIPATTNAEEAMHWKLYAAIGRFLALLDGLKALYKFAEHYQQLSNAAARKLCGIPAAKSLTRCFRWSQNLLWPRQAALEAHCCEIRRTLTPRHHAPCFAKAVERKNLTAMMIRRKCSARNAGFGLTSGVWPLTWIGTILRSNLSAKDAGKICWLICIC